MPPRRENAHNKSASSRDGLAAPAAGHGKPAAAAAKTAAASCPASSSGATAGDLAAEQRQQTYAANAKLCQLVERHPCLYDRGHPNYAKKQVLDRTWELIAKECDDQVSSCKERWRNIRAAFARSINLYKTHGGPNRVKPYYLHQELQFIIEFMKDTRDKRKSDDIDTTKEEPDDEEPDDDDDDDGGGGGANDQQQDADNITVAHTPRTERDSTVQPESELAASDVEQEMPHSSDVGCTQQSQPADCELVASSSRPPRKRAADPLPQHGGHSGGPKKMQLHSASDEDASFLGTLLPDMRAMNARQKVLFKAKTFQSIREVLDTTANFPSSSDASHSAAQTVPNTAQGVINSIASLDESELQRLRAFMQSTLALGGRQPVMQVAAMPQTDNAAGGVQRQQQQQQQQRQPLPLLVKAESEELDAL